MQRCTVQSLGRTCMNCSILIIQRRQWSKLFFSSPAFSFFLYVFFFQSSTFPLHFPYPYSPIIFCHIRRDKHFGEYAFVSCRDLDEKSDTKPVCTLNMKLQSGDRQLSFVLAPGQEIARHMPPVKLYNYSLSFLHFRFLRVKQKIYNGLVSLRGAGRQILLPLERVRLAISLCFQSLS